jgi:RpiR family carbohydrate utilization transcriptional regulator
MNPKPNLLTQVAAALPGLSKSETKVAQAILADPEAATQSSIANLAKLAGVSEPSVNRFSKRFGAKGFPDFKIQLATSLVSGVRYMSQAVEPSDDIASYPYKLFDNTISSLILARDALPTEAIAEAVDLLSAANRILFLGLGTSAAVAKDAEHKFFRFNTPVTTQTDPLMLRMLAAGGVQGDVFFFISHTGRTKAIVEAAELAQASGATVIGLTSAKSPLARVCDCVLEVNVTENTDDYLPMTSRIVQLVLIDTLVTGVMLRGGSTLVEHVAKIKESLRVTRYPSKK